ncbi:unnamed protein product [Angiostrongylus costaricensis]|uniref:Reverse transcriptase domain-containing protein n=1 Tax=Angiostrongylus costaricensis TaxID=334426 RepID=A0A0R3PDJ4_ANGCS|nr:unnamed protein product [Angiostrongylus costaricensis]
MVVDPTLVVKRGNIDNLYSKTKAQLVNKLQEAEFPSDRDLDQQPPLSKDVKIRFNDEKCVVHETNDQATIDKADEAGPESEN